jgi:hypothetical protein
MSMSFWKHAAPVLVSTVRFIRRSVAETWSHGLELSWSISMFVSSSSMSVSLMIGLEHAYSFLVSTVILEDLLQKLSNTLVPWSSSLTTQFNVCVLFFNICVSLMTCLQLQSIGLLRISCERIHGVEINAAIFCFLSYSWSFGDFGCLHPLYQKTQL